MRVCQYEVMGISEDRQEMTDSLYDHDAEDSDSTTQDDDRIRYVKPRHDGSVEIPQAFTKRIPNYTVRVNSMDDEETVEVVTDSLSSFTRVMRPGFRVSASALRDACIDGCGEYAVEMSEDNTRITIVPA
jgi:hypothetical protein